MSDGQKIMRLDIQQYMFCHPQNVKLRKGTRKLMMWQHFPMSKELHLLLEYSAAGRVASIKLMNGLINLESLESLEKLVNRNLKVHSMGQWMAFKWATRRGNTHFQISLQDVGLVKIIEEALERSGVHVNHKECYLQRSTLTSEKIQESLQTSSQYQTQVGASQSTLCGQIEIDEPFLREPLSQLDHLAYQVSRFDAQPEAEWNDLTQVSDDMPSTEFVPKLLKPGPKCHESQSGEDADLDRGLNAGSYSTLPSLDVVKSIENCEPVHLSVESYSIGVIHHHRSINWQHAGLSSGVVLTLLPKGKDNMPVLIISRGGENIQEIPSDLKYLRIYCVGDLLLLFNVEGSTRLKGVMQLQMKPMHIEFARNWLAHWDIYSENPLETIPYTEATRLSNNTGPFSTGPFSTGSASSRESRFWARRDHARPSSRQSSISQHSMISSISRISRFSSVSRRSRISGMNRRLFRNT